MNKSRWCIRAPLAMVLVLACQKQSPDTIPPVSSDVESPADVGTNQEVDCADSYSVVGAIDRSVLSESIDGTVITDSSPFECTLKDTRQQVLFTFNESATDPSNSCKYTLAYKNDVTGATFSGTQALSCSNATLDFSTTAAADDPTNCPDVPPDDPKILLKMKNCGTED